MQCYDVIRREGRRKRGRGEEGCEREGGKGGKIGREESGRYIGKVGGRQRVGGRERWTREGRKKVLLSSL